MTSAVRRTAIDPPCDRWTPLAEKSYASMDERSRRFREQLGLPTDRPIVMTGHQAEWWHCGVLAKFLAVEGVCRRSSLAPAWIVPDQDEADFAELRVPVTDSAGRLRAATVRLTEAPPPGTASGGVPAFEARAVWPDGVQPALESVASGVARITDALNAHRNARSGARQVIGALSDLLAPMGVVAPVLYATELSRTAAFQSFIERLRSDARGAVAAYNRAVADHPDAGVAPLKVDGERVELPLWRIQPDGRRKRVLASDLDSQGAESLAPRALVLTGLLRWGACDLFVHGTGGGAYDPITEQWLSDWLGAGLAPAATATADVLLPLPGAEVSEEDAARAAWTAHGARHNPAILDDPKAQSRKRALVDAIEAAPRHSPQRAGAFRSLHEWISAQRLEHADRLGALERRARELRASAGPRSVAHDRTWAFFLHEPGAIEDLRANLCTGAAQRQACGVR